MSLRSKMFSKALVNGLLAIVACVGPVLFATPAACQGPALGAANNANIRNLIVYVHNAYRNIYHAPAVTWNATFQTQIQNAINTCPDTDPPVASGYSYGENWYGFWVSGAQINYTEQSRKGVQAWGEERKYYNWTDPGNSNGQDVGHFTQVVWKSTKSIACAWNTVKCNSPHWQNQFLCGYYPPGNVIWGGRGDKWQFYRQNVLQA